MHHYARRSLISLTLTALAITANHLYTLGPTALVLGVALLVLPTAFLWWFRNTKSRLAFAGYLAMSAWIVGGFGLFKGLWGVTLPLFAGSLLASLSESFPRPTLGTFGYEATGILMFVSSLFVAYYTFRFVQAKRASAADAQQMELASGRAKLVLATGSVVVAAIVLFAYGLADLDRWIAPADGVVKIGVIAPTRGPYAILGGSFLRAVQMAREDLRVTKYRYELLPVDVGSDPEKAGEAIARVVQRGQLDAIVGGISLFGQVTKPYATAARIPHLCVCSVTSIGDGAYNFTNIPSPEAEAKRWVEEARRRGITSVALLISRRARAAPCAGTARGARRNCDSSSRAVAPSAPWAR
jgi:hypothetical protein